MQKLSGVIEMSYILSRVLIKQKYSFIKIHQITQLRFVHFTVCKFYLISKKTVHLSKFQHVSIGWNHIFQSSIFWKKSQGNLIFDHLPFNEDSSSWKVKTQMSYQIYDKYCSAYRNCSEMQGASTEYGGLCLYLLHISFVMLSMNFFKQNASGIYLEGTEKANRK